ncbi:hypothetical protein CsatA_003181 [Cannabis sativa]
MLKTFPTLLTMQVGIIIGEGAISGTGTLTFQAVVAALLMNIYIVGLNQLYDIDIHKVNKPYLPLASGEYSIQTGVTIVASSAILLWEASFQKNFIILLCFHIKYKYY